MVFCRAKRFIIIAMWRDDGVNDASRALKKFSFSDDGVLLCCLGHVRPLPSSLLLSFPYTFMQSTEGIKRSIQHMVLADDDISTIVAAVEEGRAIYYADICRWVFWFVRGSRGFQSSSTRWWWYVNFLVGIGILTGTYVGIRNTVMVHYLSSIIYLLGNITLPTEILGW